MFNIEHQLLFLPIAHQGTILRAEGARSHCSILIPINILTPHNSTLRQLGTTLNEGSPPPSKVIAIAFNNSPKRD
jgi:hypothetical protein